MQGAVAQLVERLLCKQNVVGSNPFGSTMFQWRCPQERPLPTSASWMESEPSDFSLFSVGPDFSGFRRALWQLDGRFFLTFFYRERKKQWHAAHVQDSGRDATQVKRVCFVPADFAAGYRHAKSGQCLKQFRRPDYTGEWRMPWRRQAKKDVASCDKLRGDACNP